MLLSQVLKQQNVDVLNVFFGDLGKAVGHLLDYSPAVHDFAFEYDAGFEEFDEEPREDFAVHFAFGQAVPDRVQHRHVTEEDLHRVFLLRRKFLAFLWNEHSWNDVDSVPQELEVFSVF